MAVDQVLTAAPGRVPRWHVHVDGAR
jgi:hypothetical protein